MTEISNIQRRYRTIKSARIEGNILRGSGYALSDNSSVKEGGLKFVFQAAVNPRLIFTFGMLGIGNCYRLEIRRDENLFVLYRVRDGMEVYQQHTYLAIRRDFELTVCWGAYSIRLFDGDRCFLNVMNDGLLTGYWGFAGLHQDFIIPEVNVIREAPSNPEWIILGDGYSNNRWKNRHFLSWPELAFGDKADYLNACVAAGNSRRVLQIIEELSESIKGSRIILAAGADDILEQEPPELTKSNFLAMVAALKAHGAAEIHIATLLPKPNYAPAVEKLNHWIRETLAAKCTSVIDFHACLPHPVESYLVDGDFPGKNAQGIMALYTLQRAYPDTSVAKFDSRLPVRFLRGPLARVALRINSFITKGLGILN